MGERGATAADRLNQRSASKAGSGGVQPEVSGLINLRQVVVRRWSSLPTLLLEEWKKSWQSTVRASSIDTSRMFGPNSRLRFIEPQLASPVDQPLEGKHWIHEIKHDGYRSQLVIERGKALVFSRNGYDWSDRYPGVVRAAANLRCKSAIIDGEAIVQNRDGASDFEALQSAMRRQPHSIILFA